MIDPKAISSALSQKSPSGFSTFTKSQIADIAMSEDSFMAKKIRRAMDLGATKEQAISYFAFGSASGKPVENKSKQSFFDKFIYPASKGIVDYVTAPAEAAIGTGVKGLGALTGMDVTGVESVQKLPENLSKSADVARLAIPVAAGISTGGASLPVSATVSGLAGAGSSLLASGLEAEAGEDQTLGGAIGEAVVTGGANALIDAATMGLLRLAKPLPKTAAVEGAAKQIAQSKKAKDVASVARAVNEIPSDGIQTYDDLAKAFESRIKSLAAAQDKVLSSVQKSVPLQEFTTIAKAGEQSVTTNPVAQAIDGLVELYAKNGDAQALANAKNLKEIAKTGLTPKQVNDLAREFGKGYRAFSDATGNPLTSINAQMYENVRKGVKEAARSLMPNEATKVMDDAMSDIFTAKRLANRMGEAVRGLSSQLEQRGLLSKIASKIGGAIDLSLGRTPSSFFSSLLLRGNVGLKKLNSAQIQALLPKNIKMIQELTSSLDTLPESTVIQKVLQLMGKSGTVQKALVGEAANLTNQ